MSQSYYNCIASTFQDYAITYSKNSFNHFPMSIASLEAFGASEQQLNSFSRYYLQRLVHPRGSNEQTEINKHATCYLTQLNKLGIARTLQEELPKLIGGIGAGNFYALNRLGHAVTQQNISDIAWSLALWKVMYMELGELGETTLKRPTSLLRRLAKTIGHIRFSADDTPDRMMSIPSLIDYQQVSHQPYLIDLNIVASAAATIYKMSGDFIMLHSVTACWALGQLIDYLPDQELALRYLWQAIVVAYISAGSPVMNNVDKVELIPWPVIINFCCNSHNEHLIELCHACYQLHERLQLDTFHQLATYYVSRYQVSL